jgi:hypothetical protein
MVDVGDVVGGAVATGLPLATATSGTVVPVAPPPTGDRSGPAGWMDGEQEAATLAAATARTTTATTTATRRAGAGGRLVTP